MHSNEVNKTVKIAWQRINIIALLNLVHQELKSIHRSDWESKNHHSDSKSRN
jgi:hypothetical protein